MRLNQLPRAMALGAFGTVCLAPFWFGAVERKVWIPLSELWLGLGLASSLLRLRLEPAGGEVLGARVSRALLPLHVLFAVQLVPMPAALLRLLSPGSFAAHFFPDPGDGRFRPLSVSPSATIEAWLYFAGLQGLFLALLSVPRSQRNILLRVLLGAILVLASEGLWQSRSAHPYWLYGLFPLWLPSGLETSIFGPYLNRNHFATVMAMGAGLGAGLASTVARRSRSMVRLLSDPSALSRTILLAGAAAFLAVTSAASGSRSGAIAALLAIAVIAARSFGTRLLLVSLSLGAGLLVLTGAFAVERLLRLDIMASRWTPWVDMTRLFRFFPVFGSGLGTFAVAYWPYQTTVTYEFWQHAHNEYLEFLIEGGISGAIALFLIARALRTSVGLGEENKLASMAAVAAFMAQSFFDFPLRIPANAAILTCILALTVSRKDD